MTPCPEICKFDCEYEAQELDQRVEDCRYGNPHRVGPSIIYMSREQKEALEAPYEVPEVRI